VTEQKSAPVKRKTEPAIKISASWTPSEAAASELSGKAFGKISPLRIRGGRLTINAAISMGDGKPASVIRAYERVEELRRELEDVGTVHSFSSGPGAVPVGEAEKLPDPEQDE
jgi:hypothetical protein